MKLPNLKTLVSLAAAASLALAPAAFAHGHGYRGGWHGGYHGYHGHYRHYHGHYDRAGRWIAGAIVAGALTSLVIDATTPRTTTYYDNGYAPYYDGSSTVVYSRAPRTVVYEDAPVVVERRRVVETTRVYDDHGTRYIRDDGWRDGD
ncbi:hypothetical protein [Oleiagrimonas sp. C23AA]|uniref:hypothetical protein n=1 Tax=Oleiagrimonas sp. C23AA TaxID=2719047 RepID=UPI00141F3BD2|nr:hypothetical protein [Oleiagrimonas sp. C23AA]NII09074.1 hypothetical protein [Oleiagrimonas sp. C23AA]